LHTGWANLLSKHLFSHPGRECIELTQQRGRINRVEPSGHANTQKDTTYNFTYAYAGPQEHAPTHIGPLAYSYDADGNQTGFTDDSSGQRQTIVWNEENQIQSLSNNGQETDYVYDDSGQRVIKRGQLGETIAGMTPCMRLYAFLGQSLARTEVAPAYADWVKTYADPGFEALAVRLEALLDAHASDSSAVRANYRRAMELEYGFFDANG